LRKFYQYKGLANLELNNIDQAVQDLEKALDDNGSSFDVNLGLARGYYNQEKFGSTFLRADALKSLATTDKETALAHYWLGLSEEKRGFILDAVKDWQELLAMDASAMTPDMRTEAEQHLKALVTPTNTPTVTNTPRVGTATPTLKPGKATPTSKAGTTTPTPKSGTTTPTPKANGSATVNVTVQAGKTPSLTPTP
jgi:hypothetical protein